MFQLFIYRLRPGDVEDEITHALGTAANAIGAVIEHHAIVDDGTAVGTVYQLLTLMNARGHDSSKNSP